MGPLRPNPRLRSCAVGRRHNLPLGDLAEIIKREDPAGMTIAPVHLEGVITHLSDGLRTDILGDLGALRREMVDHILELQSSV